MALLGAIKGLMDKLQGGSFTELPPGIAEGLGKQLREGEEIVLTLLDWRAVHKAPTFTDSNTYFNSWFILTDRRIIIARSSSGFKRFREIPLVGITDVHYELDRSEPRIIITTPGNVDTIEFQRKTAEHVGRLEEILETALADARRAAPGAVEVELVFCGACGGRIPKSSRFCAECGVRITAG